MEHTVLRDFLLDSQDDMRRMVLAVFPDRRTPDALVSSTNGMVPNDVVPLLAHMRSQPRRRAATQAVLSAARSRGTGSSFSRIARLAVMFGVPEPPANDLGLGEKVRSEAKAVLDCEGGRAARVEALGTSSIGELRDVCVGVVAGLYAVLLDSPAAVVGPTLAWAASEVDSELRRIDPRHTSSAAEVLDQLVMEITCDLAVLGVVPRGGRTANGKAPLSPRPAQLDPAGLVRTALVLSSATRVVLGAIQRWFAAAQAPALPAVANTTGSTGSRRRRSRRRSAARSRSRSASPRGGSSPEQRRVVLRAEYRVDVDGVRPVHIPDMLPPDLEDGSATRIRKAEQDKAAAKRSAGGAVRGFARGKEANARRRKLQTLVNAVRSAGGAGSKVLEGQPVPDAPLSRAATAAAASPPPLNRTVGAVSSTTDAGGGDGEGYSTDDDENGPASSLGNTARSSHLPAGRGAPSAATTATVLPKVSGDLGAETGKPLNLESVIAVRIRAARAVSPLPDVASPSPSGTGVSTAISLPPRQRSIVGSSSTTTGRPSSVQAHQHFVSMRLADPPSTSPRSSARPAFSLARARSLASSVAASSPLLSDLSAGRAATPTEGPRAKAIFKCTSPAMDACNRLFFEREKHQYVREGERERLAAIQRRHDVRKTIGLQDMLLSATTAPDDPW